MKAVHLPSNLTTIKQFCFAGCKKLVLVEFPASLDHIEEQAFKGCTYLENIDLPEGFSGGIDDSAFENCVSIEQLTIPASLTSLCYKDRDGNITSSYSRVRSKAFGGCIGLTTLTVLGEADIRGNAFIGCRNLVNINASTAWKDKHYKEFPCLSNYTPSPPPKEGCYIATAVYHTYDCPQVWTFRRFRDQTLYRTYLGRLFIRIYYATSPTIIHVFHSESKERLIRMALDKFALYLQSKGYKSTPYIDNR